MELKTRFSRIKRSIRRLARTHYPGFLFGLPITNGEIPIFVYHDVEKEHFASDLKFLRKNSYRTLGIDDLIQCVQSGDTERKVLITFDDARRNFLEVAFPLLKEFDAKATLFVPTKWVGMGMKKGIDKKINNENMFMTWDELRSCRASSLVDVQSHSHSHALVYSSNELVGFASPQSLSKYDIYDWPLRNESGVETLANPPLGTPIYEAVPLLSAKTRVFENPNSVWACREVVNENGGKKFFEQSNWSAQLKKVHDDFTGKYNNLRTMDEESFHALVESEFKLSKELFEEKLGISPEYFAYPWMLGSSRSMSIAKQFGIEVIFGVGMDFRYARKRIDTLTAFGRLKGDWLRFLPGRGRLRIRDVFPQKIKQFFHAQHLAH